MKLNTQIAPRKDGTVKVQGLDGAAYVFRADESGDLSCDVANDVTVAHLLAGGNFYPADTADFDAAVKLAKSVSDEDDEDPNGDDLDDDEGDESALPVEAGTPPAPAKKPRKAAAK